MSVLIASVPPSDRPVDVVCKTTLKSWSPVFVLLVSANLVLLALSNETFTTLTNWNTPTKSVQGTFSSGIYTSGIAGRYLFYTNTRIDTIRFISLN